MNPADPPERVRRPLMVQVWRQAGFIHWPYAPEAVQRLLPRGLEVETCEGRAWVGLVPFLLTVFPMVRAAPEINLRTYVRGPDGGRGIYFFSLELGRPLAALVARAGYHIPYVWADVRCRKAGTAVVYSSRRRPPVRQAEARIEIEPGASLAGRTGELEIFLTARFTLYAGRRRLWRAQVEHPAWALHEAGARVDQGLTAAAGLPEPAGDPHVLYSPGTRALVGPPARVSRHASRSLEGTKTAELV